MAGFSERFEVDVDAKFLIDHLKFKRLLPTLSSPQMMSIRFNWETQIASFTFREKDGKKKKVRKKKKVATINETGITEPAGEHLDTKV